MTLERRSPLPVGRYWVDLFKTESQDQWAQFDQWLAENVGIVEVESAEMFDSDPPRQWILFRVTGGKDGKFLPEWVGIGFPTIADPNIHSSSDTSQVPDVDKLPPTALESAGKVLLIGGALVLGAVLLTNVTTLVKTFKGK